MSGRLDDEKLETLRRWGAGLGDEGRDELRAAGKAILILIEEIERLQVDVWHRHDSARPQVNAGAPTPPVVQIVDDGPGAATVDGAETSDGLEPTLTGRLRRLLPGRHVKIE